MLIQDVTASRPVIMSTGRSRIRLTKRKASKNAMCSMLDQARNLARHGRAQPRGLAVRTGVRYADLVRDALMSPARGPVAGGPSEAGRPFRRSARILTDGRRLTYVAEGRG